MKAETKKTINGINNADESHGEYIINSAKRVNLDPGILYEAVIDLSEEGMLTATSINLAAGILLNDLWLPNYFFENITKDSLRNILETIATSLKEKDGEVSLIGRVSHGKLMYAEGKDTYSIRIATEETRDQMEAAIGPFISGHRREYYYNPGSKYYTYLVKPTCILDCASKDFNNSTFLFSLSDDFRTTPKETRNRYENFLRQVMDNVNPIIETCKLPAASETRFMFVSDFALPQMPVLRRLFEDNGLILRRAYWEPYYTGGAAPSSMCSLYAYGEISPEQESRIMSDLCAFLAFAINPVTELYANGKLTFQEMIFSGNLIDFTHLFIYKDNHSDTEIFQSLSNDDQRDAFSNRMHDSNKSSYVYRTITEYVRTNPDLIKFLFNLFDLKFNPSKQDSGGYDVNKKYEEYHKIISQRFMDDPVGFEILKYMFRFNTALLKTNFYKKEKRAYSFRFINSILDPLVFNQFVYGIFFVNGHYACGIHMSAKDISRGSLGIMKITKTNYGAEIDKSTLLNYTQGPKAQRLKHKDICESGSKGLIIPYPIYANMGFSSLMDYSDALLDLMLPSDDIVDFLGKNEMIFFEPDDGTLSMMDTVAFHARDRGYKHWRTITTGKSSGIPQNNYGLLYNGDMFAIFDRGAEGVELQINEETVITSPDPEPIYDRIGGRIEVCGMTTTSVMSSFRALIDHYEDVEEELNLMMTIGQEEDTGANQIYSYKGKICLVIDSNSVLFDPKGLDKKELAKSALMHHQPPNAGYMSYPSSKLSSEGFLVTRSAKNTQLYDGTIIEDGAVFHRNFLINKINRKYIEKANIKAFIPCGGFNDTINGNNVRSFLSIFKELKYIVEGVNLFFDDSSRRYIARNSEIKQIKDSTANKGGVISSSFSEVLAAFLLGDSYEEKLINNTSAKWKLIRNIQNIIYKRAYDEVRTLLNLYEKNQKTIPLFVLSIETSEEILDLQDKFEERLDKLLEDRDIVWAILERYIPETLTEISGREEVLKALGSDEVAVYRNAIITKKLAAMAFYKYAADWKSFLSYIQKDFQGAVRSILS